MVCQHGAVGRVVGSGVALGVVASPGARSNVCVCVVGSPVARPQSCLSPLLSRVHAGHTLPIHTRPATQLPAR
jgi:hypothetical protein